MKMGQQDIMELAGFKENEVEDFLKGIRRTIVCNTHKGRSWANPNQKQFLISKLLEEVAEYLKSDKHLELLDVAVVCLMLYARKENGID